MRFGVFDHMDRNGLDLGQQYADRLQLVQAYDEAGFHAYHLAEHHGTPLGLASSPNVFLAAVSQRTRSLRFGPLVYTLSIYHPLRAIEEICMLDQLSGGRLELGIGRGISPIEMGFYGAGDDTKAIYEEVSDIVLKGLDGGRLNHAGKYFTFDDVPLELTAVQRPHPPLWYGAARPDTAAWAAARRMNIVTNGPAADVRKITDQFRATWAGGPHAAAPLPLAGMSRHIVIGLTDAEAADVAAPAYDQWFSSLLHLWRIHGLQIPLNFPEDFNEARDAGLCIAGSAGTVRDVLARELRESGVNYLLCRMAFGNLALEQSMQSVALMEREVMPAFTANDGDARASRAAGRATETGP